MGGTMQIGPCGCGCGGAGLWGAGCVCGVGCGGGCVGFSNFGQVQLD